MAIASLRHYADPPPAPVVYLAELHHLGKAGREGGPRGPPEGFCIIRRIVYMKTFAVCRTLGPANPR